MLMQRLGYDMDEWVNDIWFDADSFLFLVLSNIQTGSEAQLEPLAIGNWGSFSGVKRPGREAMPLMPNINVKNLWSYITNSPYVFTVSCLIMHRIMWSVK